ncbi:MAG: hypothetical protein IM600_08095 [Bacteroidetes bacterium]|jgi:hypothetical protein|nr:hypothetical protein [Bacteroidota bacterium]MCA6443373.1 hypothetical protein [Bacteroidota bacterium]
MNNALNQTIKQDDFLLSSDVKQTFFRVISWLSNNLSNRLIVLTVFCFTTTICASQIQTNIPHETINSASVKYHSINSVNSSTAISVVPNCTLTLKNPNLIKSIKFQVLSKQNQSVLYSANHLLNSPPVIENGNLIFSKSGAQIILSSPTNYPLGSVKLRVYTIDNNNLESKPYIVN